MLNIALQPTLISTLSYASRFLCFIRLTAGKYFTKNIFRPWGELVGER